MRTPIVAKRRLDEVNKTSPSHEKDRFRPVFFRAVAKESPPVLIGRTRAQLAIWHRQGATANDGQNKGENYWRDDALTESQYIRQSK